MPLATRAKTTRATPTKADVAPALLSSHPLQEGIAIIRQPTSTTKVNTVPVTMRVKATDDVSGPPLWIRLIIVPPGHQTNRFPSTLKGQIHASAMLVQAIA
jgi:hypothetical protein